MIQRVMLNKAAAFKLLFLLLVATLQLDAGTGQNPDIKMGFTAVDIHGNPVHVPGKGKTLLLFFNPGNTYEKMIVFYTQALHNKFKEQGFQVIGIARGEESRLKSFAQKSATQFPFVLDKDSRIQELFGVAECCGATIIIDHDGNTRQSFKNLLDEGNLRQLVEKEVSGKITYDFNRLPQQVFITGKKVPDIPLEDAGTGETCSFEDIAIDNLVVTFFSSLCGICKTGKRLRTIADVERDLKAGRKDDVTFLLVFMGPFDKEDILEYGKKLPMPYDTYITKYLFSEEEKYITDKDLKTDPLTILLDKEKKIVFMEEAGISEENLSTRLLEFISRR
ncbi:MAG: hypothetical protein QG657_2890 [Acidobacteriota bacterium]|nr:hypothetical protein [Acidobacteriota bacterium]